MICLHLKTATVDFPYNYDAAANEGMRNEAPQSFWRWRRPNFTNTGIPTNSTPTGSADAIASIFGDVELSDVILKGSDGGTVNAVRAILASRSTMFRSKFFGKGAREKGLTIPGEKQVVFYKHWDCRILLMIVEYCYTDSCSILRIKPAEDVARLVAQLRVASKAFKLPGLLDTIKTWGWRTINRHPALACAMIDEGMKRDDIDELALQTLQLKARAAMLPNQNAVGSGVLALSKPGLLFALRTLEDTTSHILILQVIERWVDFSPEDSNSDSPSRERQTRESFGRKCAVRFVKIAKINPTTFERAMGQSKMFSNRNDLTASSLMEGIKFTEKATSPENVSTERRPQTAIGLTRLPVLDAARRTISQ